MTTDVCRTCGHTKQEHDTENFGSGRCLVKTMSFIGYCQCPEFKPEDSEKRG